MSSDSKVYEVGGMSSRRCVRAITEALTQVLTDCQIHVQLEGGRVTVTGEHDEDIVQVLVEGVGYDFKGQRAS